MKNLTAMSGNISEMSGNIWEIPVPAQVLATEIGFSFNARKSLETEDVPDSPELPEQ